MEPFLNNEGYIIPDSHVRLGSKTHIKDFIYAKKLFQNSSFAHPFAFIISNFINTEFINKNILEGDKSLTIIGYGEYSQMLINRIIQTFQERSYNINHDYISDVEDTRFIKNERLNDNIIIIVPIGTTFSTAIKMEERIKNRLREENRNCKILDPFINIILVSHNDLDNETYVNKLNTILKSSKGNHDEDILKQFPYIRFNWTNVDRQNRMVSFTTNPPAAALKRQKYFILAKSEWHLMDLCEMCYPKNPLNEKPLLTTDKASVTPDVTLHLPCLYNFKSNLSTENLFINPESYFWGHLHYKGNSYLHYIDSEAFYRGNKEAINEWLQKLKQNLQSSDKIRGKKTVLIAPSDQTNTYFLELINRHIFEDMAQCIYYDSNHDYLNNFLNITESSIRNSDLIYYVDDFIKTGHSFHTINDFVKIIHNSTSKNSKQNGLRGVITLINKTDSFNYTDIINQLKSSDTGNDFVNERFYSFLDLRIQSIQIIRCPLCQEQERYEYLFNNSMLDTIRHYFLNKKLRLNPKKEIKVRPETNGWDNYNPLVLENSVFFPWEDNSSIELKELWNTFKKRTFPPKAYLKFIIQHCLDNIVSNNESIRQLLINGSIGSKEEKFNVFQKLKEQVLNEVQIKSILLLHDDHSQSLLKQIISELIIKVCTHPPLSTFNIVRQNVFTWVLIELDHTLKKMEAEIIPNFRTFRYLKFLLRRSVILGSNFLISLSMLETLRNIYKGYNLSKKNKIEERRSERINTYNIEIERLKEELKIKLSNLSKPLPGEIEFPDSNTEIDTIQLKIEYLKQAISNIQYKIATLNEFNYFYTALVKELSLNNDAKILRLEKNIQVLLGEVKQEEEPDFYFLLRLLKYENVSLLYSGLKLIAQQLKEEIPELELKVKFSDKNLYNKLKECILKILEDYRLANFRAFLNIDKIDEWVYSVEFRIYSHILYLMVALERENDNPDTEMSLGNKTKTIINNIYRIVGYYEYDDIETDAIYINRTEEKKEIYNDDLGQGAFIALRYKGNKYEPPQPDEIIILQATGNISASSSVSILNEEIDRESLVFLMLKGISHRSPSNRNFKYFVSPHKPWTLWEISLEKNGEHWQSLRGPIYPVDDYPEFKNLLFDDSSAKFKRYFTEELYVDGNPTQFLFYRIGDIFENKPGSQEIVNEGQVLLSFFRNKGVFEIERTRLLLLLRPFLHKFFESHYESDSVAELIQERMVLNESQKLGHDYHYILAGLKNLVSDKDSGLNQEDKKNLAAYYSSILDYKSLLHATNIYKKTELDNTKLPKESEFSLSAIQDEFIKIARLVFPSDNIKERISNEKIIFTLDDIGDNQIKVIIKKELLYTMLIESIFNIKKRYRSYIGKLKINLKFKRESNIIWLIIKNNTTLFLPSKLLLMFNKNNIKYNTKGIGLIKRISHQCSGEFARIKQEYGDNNSKWFLLEIPFNIAE